MKEKINKIILIGNYAPDRQESMQRFASMLQEGFECAGFPTKVWCPTVIFGKFVDPSQTIVGKWLGYIDKFVFFPVQIKLTLFIKGKANTIFHICDHSNAPYLKYLPKDASGITCHDVLAIRGALGYNDAHCKPTTTGVFLQKWILRNLEKAQRLAAVSDLTLRQLAEITSLPKKKGRHWQVIHNAFNAPFSRMEKVTANTILKKLTIDLETAFILHVGSSLGRKNRKMLIQMVASLGNRWTGNICFAGDPLDEELLVLAGELGLTERITSVVKPDHETLVALYSTCEAFVFPSFSEGFGWPLIEAQACGAPVIASSTDPMPEVSGGAAIHISPFDPLSFADAFMAIQNEQPELVNRGYQNTKRFKTERMIEQYLLMFNLVPSNMHKHAFKTS